jgi:hypothetical protein
MQQGGAAHRATRDCMALAEGDLLAGKRIKGKGVGVVVGGGAMGTEGCQQHLHSKESHSCSARHPEHNIYPT